jgi:hypothetical protein
MGEVDVLRRNGAGLLAVKLIFMHDQCRVSGQGITNNFNSSGGRLKSPATTALSEAVDVSDSGSFGGGASANICDFLLFGCVTLILIIWRYL